MSDETRKLLTVNNTKTEMGEAFGYLTAILHLMPERSAGIPSRNRIAASETNKATDGGFVSLCSHASPGCIADCLRYAGRLRMTPAIDAAIWRTRLLVEKPATFFFQLWGELEKHMAKAEKRGLVPAFRPGGTHDTWAIELGTFRRFPQLQGYDYTKNPKRAWQFLRGELPPNYHVTFSRSETNERQARKLLDAGCNVAVVFRRELPETFWNVPVINGTEHDLRFLDKRPRIVGLLAKGKAKRDESGFVVDN